VLIIHLFQEIFLGTETKSIIFFNSNLYTQYHCLPLILTVKILDSFCHSKSFKIKLEFTKILKHQIVGTIQAKKSPHLP